MKQPRRNLFTLAGGALLVGALLVPVAAQAQSDVLPPPNALAPAQPGQPARQAQPARPAVTARPSAAPIPGLAAAPSPDEIAVAGLVAEVVAQQAKLVENQKLIDDKLAIIAENLRIARIYVSRAK